MHSEKKYSLNGLFGMMMLIVMLVACNGYGSNKVAFDQVKTVSKEDVEPELDADSVQCFILPEIQKDESGKVLMSSVQKTVLKSKHYLLKHDAFVEIFSTDTKHPWFIYNLEAIRRQFIKEGVDPILIATRKHARSLPAYDAGVFGFSVVYAEN